MGKIQDIFERLSNLNSIMKKKILKKIVETNIQKCPYCISQDFIKNIFAKIVKEFLGILRGQLSLRLGFR